MSKKKNFPLRIDPELYNDLRKWADDEFRSVNAQIEVIIKKALKENNRLNSQKK
ncbi:ribbon-helix-helix domain-containing protein [Priestia flexa]|uniref:ribbon-helix-helix domain-containing protein n=1 Tax=Priestia flexa TaxID=86664 RepID=UPI001CD56004|nr:Arc family DNA-binding protein [Priestia flexa]MCA1202183.1 Arc family DNA-binding protein [Priestia flexa]